MGTFAQLGRAGLWHLSAYELFLDLGKAGTQPMIGMIAWAQGDETLRTLTERTPLLVFAIAPLKAQAHEGARTRAERSPREGR